MARTLYFLGLVGCEACAEAKPHVDAFESDHPDVEVVRVDLTDEDWPEDATLQPPEFTPAYVSFTSGQRPRTIQGRILTADELDRWIYARG